MVELKTLDSSVISFIILIIIFLHSYSKLESIFIQYKLFNTLVILNMSLIVIDILGWVFNGLPGSLNYFFNTGFNVLLYIVVPMAPSVWVMYTYYLVASDEHKIKNLRNTLVALLVVNAAITFISLLTGWYFSVDASNVYHRGPLFFLYMSYCGLLLLYSFIFVLIKRKHFKKIQFYSIMLFYIPQVIGTSIQALNYGVSYNWSGMMISLLIIHFNLQSRSLNTDYLTGVNNRMHFHGYIKAKIRSCSEKKTFGAVMIDIDNFKKINDNFGHGTGDEALKDAVHILKESLRRDDFIARFGGDEFLVVIDTQSIRILEDTIKRIKDKAKIFNAQFVKPYTLSFSMGYDIYNIQTKMKADDFIDHLDRLMYEDKLRKTRIDG